MAKVKSHFPSIFRSFPEKLFGLLFFLLLLAVVASGIRIYDRFQQYQRVLGERQLIAEKITYWEEVTKKYKGYRDAYFQLAVLHYQLDNLDNKDKSYIYVQEALKLDPNFEEGRKLEQFLK